MWHTSSNDSPQCVTSPTILPRSSSNSTIEWSNFVASPTETESTTTQLHQDEKRRTQNRAAQRAFRSRKKQYQSHLESQVWLSELAVAELKGVKARLAKTLCRLEVENVSLRASLTDSKAKRVIDLDYSLREFDHILEHLHEPSAAASLGSKTPRDPKRMAEAARILYPTFKTLWDLAKAYVEPENQQLDGALLTETFDFLKEKAFAEDQMK